MSQTVLSLWRGETLVPVPKKTPGQIIAEVAEKHGFTREDMESPCRRKPIALARQEAMWELRKRTSLSLPHIGMFLGNRDHTTVMHGIRRHEQRIGEGA